MGLQGNERIGGKGGGASSATEDISHVTAFLEKGNCPKVLMLYAWKITETWRTIWEQSRWWVN